MICSYRLSLSLSLSLSLRPPSLSQSSQLYITHHEQHEWAASLSLVHFLPTEVPLLQRNQTPQQTVAGTEIFNGGLLIAPLSPPQDACSFNQWPLPQPRKPLVLRPKPCPRSNGECKCSIWNSSGHGGGRFAWELLCSGRHLPSGKCISNGQEEEGHRGQCHTELCSLQGIVAAAAHKQTLPSSLQHRFMCTSLQSFFKKNAFWSLGLQSGGQEQEGKEVQKGGWGEEHHWWWGPQGLHPCEGKEGSGNRQPQPCRKGRHHSNRILVALIWHLLMCVVWSQFLHPFSYMNSYWLFFFGFR